jgi:nucleotide-binding universal stress UspA family protein
VYNRILVPVDGSDTSHRGLEEAIKLAKALAGRIRLVHVVNELSGIPSDLPGFDFRSIVEDLRRNGEVLLASALKQVSAEAVDADSRLLETWHGHAAGEQIIRCAEDWPADLIVCGTHGRRGIRRILMGSDAEFILRQSPVPVLLIRAQRSATQGKSGPVAP